MQHPLVCQCQSCCMSAARSSNVVLGPREVRLSLYDHGQGTPTNEHPDAVSSSGDASFTLNEVMMHGRMHAPM